ncbi:MAG: LysR family transcriptional regulator [Syntrophobacterales bacterium]|nr:LysR family transcriptional regulator [Syntrophobacterales bacterium]
MKYDGFKNITFQQMEALVHLVEERSFSRAAKKMLLTQPALTKHIKNIEEVLGAKVVNRGGAGLSLTPEGNILHDYAGRILRLRDEVKEKIENARGNAGGVVTVAASTIPATYILPRILKGFQEVCPGIQVRIESMDSEKALDNILNGEADIGFVGKSPPGRRIYAEAFWPDRLILVVPAGHPWAKRKSVSAKELVKEPFVTRERGSATREVVESCLKQNGGLNPADLNVAAELGSSEAVKEAVVAGVGASVISIHAVAREIRQGLLSGLTVKGCPFARSFYLIYRRRLDLMQYHRLFIDYARRQPIPADVDLLQQRSFVTWPLK